MNAKMKNDTKMGDLFNQQPRSRRKADRKIIDFIKDDVIEVAKQTGLNYDQVLKAYEILELERKNDLYVDNGDIHDEQMGGFGGLIQDLNVLILGLSNNIEKLKN